MEMGRVDCSWDGYARTVLRYYSNPRTHAVLVYRGGLESSLCDTSSQPMCTTEFVLQAGPVVGDASPCGNEYGADQQFALPRGLFVTGECQPVQTLSGRVIS